MLVRPRGTMIGVPVNVAVIVWEIVSVAVRVGEADAVAERVEVEVSDGVVVDGARGVLEPGLDLAAHEVGRRRDGGGGDELVRRRARDRRRIGGDRSAAREREPQPQDRAVAARRRDAVRLDVGAAFVTLVRYD